MPEKPLFIRNTEGSRVYYDVLSSKRTFYYSVEMLGLLATSCDCNHHAKGHKHCKHQDTAEKAEQEFQQNSVEIPTSKTVERREAPLNGQRGFSLLKL